MKYWIGLALIITSFTTYCLYWVRIEPFKFTSDAVLGAMATLIGVCATIIVGFQIYNSIEHRREIKKIKGLLDRSSKKFKSLEDDLNVKINDSKNQIEEGIQVKINKINADITEADLKINKFYGDSSFIYDFLGENLEKISELDKKSDILLDKLEFYEKRINHSSENINKINDEILRFSKKATLFQAKVSAFDEQIKSILEKITRDNKKYTLVFTNSLLSQNGLEDYDPLKKYIKHLQTIKIMLDFLEDCYINSKDNFYSSQMQEKYLAEINVCINEIDTIIHSIENKILEEEIIESIKERLKNIIHEVNECYDAIETHSEYIVVKDKVKNICNHISLN